MTQRGFPLIEVVAAFLGANLVYARFEKVARASVATGLMAGLYDLGDKLERDRAGALRNVPREVRARIRAEIDARLAAAGVTRTQARAVVQRLEEVRVERGIVAKLRRLL